MRYTKEEVGYELLLDIETSKSPELPYIQDFISSFKERFENEIFFLKEEINIFKNEGFSDGVTYFAILSESHFSIHSYPEVNIISINLYFCSNKISLFKEIEKFMIDYFDFKSLNIKLIKRGI